MKNKSRYFLIFVLIICLLTAGCASRNPLSPLDSSPSQTQSPEQNLNQPEPAAGKVLKVHFIDVGQGDAILIQTPSGQNMLIDAGENDQGNTVVNYLTAQGVKDLAVVVGTHPHSDHIGGLDTVINHFPIGNLYMPQATHTTKTFLDVLTAIKNKGLSISTAKAGVVLPLNGVNCRFVAPLKDTYEDLNNYSAVIRLEYGSQSFLFCGDAETESETQMLSSGAQLKCTAIKIGHHGSNTSTGSKFLKAARPQWAVIMVGKDNSYGHPHAQTLSRLSQAGATVYRTDLSGTIVFSTDGNDMQITKER
ncbi:MAG: ComEC/Rec2 family competence protein [Syntrophomonadaceae bacterium]|nr:ComEC/Rec2 family competence protein [Syntrophomonadaceae bacterium]